MSEAVAIPTSKETVADLRKRRTSDAAVIAKLPALIKSALYRDQEGFRTISHDMLKAVEAHHPKIHSQLKRHLGSQHFGSVKAPPIHIATFDPANVCLADVILDQTATATVQELLVEHQRRAELEAYGLQPRHKLLLIGPPGNGKTLLAEALAQALDVDFISAKYSGLMSSQLGQSGKHLDELLQFASNGPCVLFMDEFDTVAMQRGGNPLDVGEAQRITNQLLTSMNALPSHTIFIAATNMAGIDKAVLRRFDCVVSLGKPTHETRLRLASLELALDLTPGSDLTQWVEPVASLELENLHEVTLLCRRIRRDQALYAGRGIQTIISAVATSPL